MISTCSRLRSHLKFCGIKLGNRAHRTTNPKVQVNKASETTWNDMLSQLPRLVDRFRWLVPMASKMNGSVLGKFDSSQTSESPESCRLRPAPCGEPTGEINQTHCGLGGRVQLAHLKKSRCCIWDVGTIWEPSGNHLGTIWEPSGNHLGTIWEPSGNHLGTIWEPSGNHLGTIWEPSGNHLGTIWERPNKMSAPLSSCMQHLLIGEKNAMPCGIDGICQVRWRLPFGH